MGSIARVVILSPLPQLDKEFDYEIPQDLDQRIEIGSRVLVPFGRGKRELEGVVVEIVRTSEFKGRIAGISEVLSEQAELPISLLASLRELHSRSVSTLGELIKSCIGNHMPKIVISREEQQGSLELSDLSISTRPFVGEAKDLVLSNRRSHFLAPPIYPELSFRDIQWSAPGWIVGFIELARSSLAQQRSVLILLPDFREISELKKFFNQVGLSDFLVDLSEDAPKSKAFKARKRALNSNLVVAIGLRGAALAAVNNLGVILMFDGADESFTDQAAPYLSALEIVLVRQSVEDLALVMCSNSISTETFRLIEIGYVKDVSAKHQIPKVMTPEEQFRSGTATWKLVKDSLADGPVLIQVANRGQAAWLNCKVCGERAVCRNCSGPVWVDDDGSRKCRWCNSFQLDLSCSCGSSDWVMGRQGSLRTASDLGKSFPGARVIEATGDSKTVSVDTPNTIVVSTPGAEPYATYGYRAVIILDSGTILGRPSLMAREDAIRTWANAISKLSRGGISLIPGLSGDLARQFAVWDHMNIARDDYRERVELQLPPAIRIGTIRAEREIVSSLAAELSAIEYLTLLGPAPDPDQDDDWRLLFKYPYSKTTELATFLKGLLVKMEAPIVRSATGRAKRPVKVNMSDQRVV